MDLKIAEAILKSNAIIYEKMAKDWAASRITPPEQLKELWNKYGKGNRLLDLGCGNGVAFSAVNKQITDYIGQDISQTMLAAADFYIKEHNTGTNPIRVKLLLGDVLNIPLADASVDVVLCFGVLHHIPSSELRQKAIKEIARVLTPGGQLLMANWNVRCWHSVTRQKLWHLWLGRSLPSLDKNDSWIGEEKKNLYIHCFHKEEIKSLISKADLKIISNDYVGHGSTFINAWHLITVAKKI
ncbi:MAG: class I SAM-dependent methyltransferase [Patescibacteria group bacterium]|jgi:ubiquinone/menaquinone biosynthesis C-methylase UbiE